MITSYSQIGQPLLPVKDGLGQGVQEVEGQVSKTK